MKLLIAILCSVAFSTSVYATCPDLSGNYENHENEKDSLNIQQNNRRLILTRGRHSTEFSINYRFNPYIYNGKPDNEVTYMVICRNQSIQILSKKRTFWGQKEELKVLMPTAFGIEESVQYNFYIADSHLRNHTVKWVIDLP